MSEAPAPDAVPIVRVSDVANEGPLQLGYIDARDGRALRLTELGRREITLARAAPRARAK